jgi:hypothetical protein
MPLGGAGLGAAPLGNASGIGALPSPAAGVGPQNQFMALAAAAAQIPQAEQEAKKKKAEAALLKTQIDQAKTQQAQTKINMLAPLAKSNPYNQDVVHALSDAYKQIGLPAPVVEDGNGPPSQTSSAGNQAGGSGTPGAPAQVGQQPAGQPGPPAPASNTQQQVGPGTPRVDVNALFPHASITDMFDKNPEFTKVWNAMKPGQRAAIAPQFGLTPGAPGYDALINAPVTKTAAEQNIDIASYRTMFQQFAKGDASLSTAQAFIASMGPRLKEDGIDVSQVITPDVKLQIGANEQAKIALYRQVGMMDAKKGDAALKEVQYKMDNLGSEMVLRSAQANLANTRASLLPAEAQSMIQSRLAASDHAAQRIGLEMQKYTDAKSKSSVTQFNQARSGLVAEATNLRDQINTLTGVGKTLLANNPNAPDPSGAVDPKTGAPMTYAQTIAQKLATLQPQLNAATKAIHDANAGKQEVTQRALQSAIGSDGTSRVKPAAAPAAQESGAPPDRMMNNRRIGVVGGKWVFRDTGQPVQ